MAIVRSTLSQQILAEVARIIQDGGYQTDDLLPTEKVLAEQLQVGRNSIREVMKMLNLTGATESIPGKGTFLRVSPLRLGTDLLQGMDENHRENLRELVEVRAAIEIEAAGLAAEKKAPREGLEKAWSALRETLLQTEAAGSRDAVWERGYQFHLEIVRMSGNALLEKIVKPLLSDIRLSRFLIPTDVVCAREEIRIHGEVVEAIEHGDAQAARAAMRRHFDHTVQVYDQTLGHEA